MPLVIRELPELAKVLGDVSYVIVDLTARAYEGVAAVEIAAHSENHVLAVGQHDDAELRRRALEAGAEQVYPYRLLFERGPTRSRNGSRARRRLVDRLQSCVNADGRASAVVERPTIPVDAVRAASGCRCACGRRPRRRGRADRRRGRPALTTATWRCHWSA